MVLPRGPIVACTGRPARRLWRASPWRARRSFTGDDFTSGVLFATRGCPQPLRFLLHCRSCTGTGCVSGPLPKLRRNTVPFHGKRIIFWDDNIAADKEYAKQLFRAIAPYRKWWSSQATIHAAQDDELLDAAARSGCKQLFLGLESVSQSSMKEVRKGFNRVEDYARIVKRVHAHGIAVQAGIVFGFDNDTPAIFKDTLDFLEETGVQNATFNILTPYPGTPLFQRLDAQGRILTRDWRKYNGRTDVVFQPEQMSVDELLAGFRYANRRFYSLPSVAKRMWRSPVQIWWALPLNFAYMASWAKANWRSFSPVARF